MASAPSGRHAGHDGVGGHVPDDHATGTDDGTRPDAHGRQDHGTGADEGSGTHARPAEHPRPGGDVRVVADHDVVLDHRRGVDDDAAPEHGTGPDVRVLEHLGACPERAADGRGGGDERGVEEPRAVDGLELAGPDGVAADRHEHRGEPGLAVQVLQGHDDGHLPALGQGGIDDGEDRSPGSAGGVGDAPGVAAATEQNQTLRGGLGHNGHNSQHPRSGLALDERPPGRKRGPVIRSAAVRGTGSIGSRHLRVLAGLGVRSLTAVPVRPGRSTSPELGGARILDTLPEGADLVVVATDTARHVADTVAALDSGARIVLVEKPLAHTTAECDALLAHPASDRVRVCAPLRFHDGLRAARAHLAALDARAARVVSQSWLPGWRPDRDYRQSYSARPGEGGVLLDLVHEIDYALWTFGAPAGPVRAVLSPVPSPVLDLEVDEAADLAWRSTSGTHVSLRLDYVTRPTRRFLDVTSPAGSVRWDAAQARVDVVGVDGTTTSTAYPRDLDRDEVLARQARALAGVLAGGPEDGLLDLATARLAVDVVERARTAHEKGIA